MAASICDVDLELVEVDTGANFREGAFNFYQYVYTMFHHSG